MGFISSAEKLHLQRIKKEKNGTLPFTITRPTETRLGQVLHTIESRTKSKTPSELLNELSEFRRLSKCRYCIVGICEDIGPRANQGKPGAANSWEAFQRVFYNMQHNAFFPAEAVCMLGHIDCEDLMDKAYGLRSDHPGDLADLRDLVARIDARVQPIVQAILGARMTPIVIGGGHNNIYPILRALNKNQKQKTEVFNLDLHADCRPLEGRHSGNGFSYAISEELVSVYSVLGLDPCYNSMENMAFLDSHAVNYNTTLINTITMADAPMTVFCTELQTLLEHQDYDAPTVATICTDTITNHPASAKTPEGLGPEFGYRFLTELGQKKNVMAVYLAESAPNLKQPDDMKTSGTFQAHSVIHFINARKQWYLDQTNIARNKEQILHNHLNSLE